MDRATLPPWFVERWLASALRPRYAGMFRQPPAWRSRRQAREDYNLYAVLSGALEVRSAAGTLRAAAGMVVLIPPGHPFADGDPDGAGTEMLSAGFSLSAGSDPLAALGLPAVAATGDPVRLARHCRELVALGTTHGFRDAAARLTARGLFDQILAAWLCAGFAAGAFPHAAPWHAPDWLWAVLDRVEARLAHGVDVPELAALAGLSQAHFSRRFRALLGRPPQAWIHERRLVRARSLLIAQPDLPVGAVAPLAGFGDAYQFSRLFRRDCGLPPERWRRAHLGSATAENVNRG